MRVSLGLSGVRGSESEKRGKNEKDFFQSTVCSVNACIVCPHLERHLLMISHLTLRLWMISHCHTSTFHHTIPFRLIIVASFSLSPSPTFSPPTTCDPHVGVVSLQETVCSFRTRSDPPLWHVCFFQDQRANHLLFS